jgi:hypothetical protein
MVNVANCLPESGGQHERDSSRDRARGGTRTAYFKNASYTLFGNHLSRHRKERDDAALLTQEGNSPARHFVIFSVRKPFFTPPTVLPRMHEPGH